MNAIVLFSHGSLLCGAGEALQSHAERIRQRGLAPIVAVGYLNYSEPLFLEAVKECVQKGATQILVSPYFLISGYFVKVEMAKAIQNAQEAFPEVEFTAAEAIGYDTRLAEALLAAAETAVAPQYWDTHLKRASDFCRPNPDCPLYATPACPKQPCPPMESA